MSETIYDNKRIAKNTLFLYFRMIVMMGITLFTSREVLRILGVSDFGIYSVVAGIVVFLAFLQTGLITAYQRFMSFDIGKGDEKQVNKTFCMSINTTIVTIVVIVVLGETIGLWFVLNKLNIPSDRFDIALFIYHLSIIIFGVNLFRSTFNSAIISYERMSFFAVISIIEAILKLLIVYVLLIANVDRLLLYVVLLLLVSFLISFCYYIYCRLSFSTCIYHFIWDNKYFIELLKFSGWSMLGGVANVSAQQGGNVLLNIFSGLSANASFGISGQVSYALYSLSSNFEKAFGPQITKLYASGNTTDLYKLVFRSSQMAFYLMLLLSVPIIIKMHAFLSLWLGNVPEYASDFCILMTIYQLIDASQGAVIFLILATGKVKSYFLWLSILLFLNLPISYILLSRGFSAVSVLVVRVAINFLSAIIRVFFLNSIISFPLFKYFQTVIMRSIIVFVISFSLSLYIATLFDNSLLGLIYFVVLSCCFSGLTMVVLGFSDGDRKILLSSLCRALSK